MNLNLEKTAEFFKNARNIWLGMVLIISTVSGVVVFAADSIYMRKSDGAKIADVLQMRQLNQRIKELTTMKGYEPDEQKVRMMEALIENNKSEIQAILNERKVTE